MWKLALTLALMVSVGCAPRWAKWTTAQGVAALQAASLEVVNPQPMSASDYGLAPLVATEGKRFVLPSVCADCSGRLVALPSPAALQQLRTYYESLGKNNAAFFSWVFVKDNLLLQLNGELSELEARRYEAALQSLH